MAGGQPPCPPRAVFGVIGHVDHGKTALVRALTGMETDRLAEEKARGISIALGFAHCEAMAPGGDTARIDLIDMPGHERFVRTMIAGATGIDAALLVVAANEGIKPQTREHLDIAALLGLDRAVVAISKADLATADEVALVAAEVAALLADLGIAAEPALPVPSRSGMGVEALREALAAAALACRPRAAHGPAWLPIDRAFSIAGHGAVVTGTLHGGAIAAGDRLELLPGGREVRLRSLQVHGQAVERAHPGERVAANLRDASAGELGRGMALASPGSLDPSPWLTLAIRAVADAPELRNGMRLRALAGTAEVDARLRLLEGDTLSPGESAMAQLHLAQPLSLPARTRVILRLASPPRTVAGGMVLEPVVRRRRRRDPQVLARLAALRALAPEAIPAAEIAHEVGSGASLRHLARLSGLLPGRVDELVAALPVAVTRRGLVFPLAVLDPLVSALPALVGGEPGGLSRNRLQTALPGTRAALLDEAIERACAAGLLVRRGPQYLLPDAQRDAAEAGSAEALREHIAETLRQGGLSPPSPSAIVTDARSRQAVEQLLRQGTVVRAVDRAKGREILFHRDAVAEARARLAPLLAEGEGLLAGEVSTALGISRKYTMPLLDHLDHIGFTRREGDRRRPGPAAGA